MKEKNLSDIYKWVWVVLIILAVFLGVKATAGLKDLKEPNLSYNSITVMGEGEAFAIPNLATFSFSISVDAPTVDAAQEKVTARMDSILSGLKDMGIEDKDIKTIDYSIYPKYNYTSSPCSPTFCPPSRQVQDGYTVNHSVSVKVRKAEGAGEALAFAGGMGATNISGISFTVEDMEKLKAEAREIAINNAKDKAEMLADELGVKLKRIISYSDGDNGYPIPYYGRESTVGMGADSVTQAKAPTLPAGENKVTVTASITYEIR